jgi:hypothetical protein
MKTRFATAVPTFLLSIVCLPIVGCGGGATGSSSGAGNTNGGGTGVTAPSALSYPNPVTATLGVAITPVPPTVAGTVTSYSVSPSFPSGLSLNGTSGVISGTPTASASQASYTVTAANASGSTTFVLSLTVNSATVPAPSALSYPIPVTATVGTAIPPLSPTVTGTVTSYSVSPALPAGVLLDMTSGVISGTPTASAAKASYTVTASNASGSTTFILSLTVNAANALAPSGLSYPIPVTTTVGTAITPLSPTVSGAVTSYSVSPVLPTGLTLDTSSGVISGTPDIGAALTTYVITASNSSGSATFELVLTAGPAAPGLAVSAASLTFTNQLVSTPSAQQKVAVTNTGATPFAVTGVTISGANASSFSEVSACSVVGASGACVIEVTFTPAATGNLSASLNIATGTAGSATVQLLGTGVPIAMSFDNPIIPAGQNATLTWSAPGATSCNASDSWIGSQATSGTQSLTQTVSGYYIYTLTCAPAGTNSVVLTVSGPTTVIPNGNDKFLQAAFNIGAPNQNMGLQTSLTVPPLPPIPTNSAATLFIWLGLEPATDSANFMPINTGVLQPVLTWGLSCAPPTVAQPARFSSWWISAQYVNTIGNDPGYMGCFSGDLIQVNPGDVLLINMSLDVPSGIWTETVADANTNQSVAFSINTQGQGQNWSFFDIEEYFDATIATPVVFSNTTITFESPDTTGSCSVIQGQNNAFTMTPPTPQNSGKQCFVNSIVVTQ